jgi:Site-specific recombinase XerD
MKNQLKNTVLDYLNHCEVNLNLSSKTVTAYRIDLYQFLKYCENNKIRFIQQVDKEILKRYIQICINKYKVSSVRRKLASLKAFFKNFEFEHEVFANPFRKFRQKLKSPQGLPKSLSLNQVSEYLNQLHRKWNDANKSNELLRDLLVIEILFQTGVRVSELSNIKRHHLNIQENSMLIYGKGSRQRYVYISNSNVIELLKIYQNEFQDAIEKTGYLFINNRGRKLSDQSIRQIVKKHNPFLGELHITPHIFRHTCATLLLVSGLNLRIIQSLLGHASITTTQIYTHISDLEMANALNKFHPRNSMK